MSIKLINLFFLCVSPLLVACQHAGTQIPVVHPPVNWQKCEKPGHCTQINGSIVLDVGYHWLHNGKGEDCFKGNAWDPVSCPDESTCAANCVHEGVNPQTFGVSTNGDSVKLAFVDPNKAIGSRFYLLANESHYEMFNLMAREFTFDVDVSTLPCGSNAALYFVSMDADGGSGRHPLNKVGAKYGSGYCDAQCPKERYLNLGQNNGKTGACCPEMDIWEANAYATAFTPHPCDKETFHYCDGATCGSTCESEGCDYNHHRMGDKSYYGPGLTVDTKKIFTVVTQFITSDGTPSGTLTEIRRFYVQNGHVIPNSASKIADVHGNSLTQELCEAQKKAFHSNDSFTKHGGMKKMGEALREGMVLAVSLWDDRGLHMQWLDSIFPAGFNASQPGVERGPCKPEEGDPKEIEIKYANAYYAFSNIRFGPINSTFNSA